MRQIDFDYLCELANLKLSREERIRLEPQIKKIIEWVNKLEELKIDVNEEKAFGIDSILPLRKDKPEISLSLEDVLSMFPEKERNFLKVPKVIEGK
ncbi:Asp-tRNA(Asn)/Glu-tRNA(Gln) amidotransferase subunit GatC [SCandidatus Aminicenantes bacterium Aminicenantia_JdfR_composite]|jgi:aspartyl/glutamyl-tRNA(Asn/Gln) amidotransferase C subunit|nr:Asp-tRNA(Asn)/Glu-tRNA(Gln) amidotransferase subunit GatC [SCandidatus Aminicenantes bacterium Aminicenantia_JdfR_composite]MCP2597732.1 Asp-tRNA(Asn)/Glu-tRNA(Gln) amidotransferase subunit GatC [Candidatus Aminicenantes bacterium AC-335-L06]MCP2620899.1 Asp-tRNA(Asn)/Glu-tRNA(Gln) amidotransferase subunit GatC [Candidatus Aminicenantes bacterium AC-334-E05]